MLVLTRKKEEKICIGPDITVTVLRVKGHAVKIGIEAPSGIQILRAELNQSAGGQEPATGRKNPPSGSTSAATGPSPAGQHAGPGGQPGTDAESTQAETGQLPSERVAPRPASAKQWRPAPIHLARQGAGRPLAACG